VKAYAALGGSFLLGAFAAGAGYHAYAERQLSEAFGGRGAFEVRRVKALSRELDLSSDQEAKILEIYRKDAPERQRLLRETMTTCGAPLEAHRDRIDGEIRALLEPEQRPKFEAQRAEHKRRFLGGPGPGGAKR
jgi:Spy/CpxP family protein refolding chaperone